MTLFRLLILLVAWTLGSGHNALADAPNKITKTEYGLIPEWCQFTQSFPGAVAQPGIYQQYIDRYGDPWSHMHHYCWAMIQTLRSTSSTLPAHVRSAYANSAVSNFDYVLEKSDRTFAFHAEVLYRKAALLRRMREYGAAMEAAEELVRDHPDRPEGYIVGADVLLATNRRPQALELLALGDSRVTDRKRFDQMKASILGR